MIWFDLDNSPHVPLFRPVITELEKRGIEYIITARNFAQTIDLLNLWKLKYYPVGVHGGKFKIKKIANILNRSLQLRKFCKNREIHLAVSHGSRSQLLASRMLKIKSILMLDYEFTESAIFNRFATFLLMPEYIPEERLLSAGFNLNKIIRYKGFKEELYINDFVPEPDFRKQLGISDTDILIVFRPPGMTGNYHDKRSEELLIQSLEYFSSRDSTICLIVNRGEIEKQFITSRIKPKRNIVFLKKAVDGLQLLYTADLTVSGGGTMNRESALLGTRTYSIFTGRRPYLDEYLNRMGRLTFIEKPEDIEGIPVEKSSSKALIKNNPDLPGLIANLLIEKSNSL